MRESTHTIVKVYLVLLAACAANLAVGWSCAAWSPIRRSTGLPEHEGPGYPETWPGGPYGEQGHWMVQSGTGFVEHVSLCAHGVEGDFNYWKGSQTPYREAGWPVLSFRSCVTAISGRTAPSAPWRNLQKWDLPLDEIIKRGIQTNSLPPFLGACKERRLPLVPIWGGFIINVLFYGVLIAGVASLPRL